MFLNIADFLFRQSLGNLQTSHLKPEMVHLRHKDAMVVS